MNFFRRIIFIAGFGICSFAAVAADYVDGNLSGQIYNFQNDSIILENAVMDYERFNMFDTVTVENHGTVFGDIYVCHGCSTAIRNSGYIDGTVRVDGYSEFNQVILDVTDITNIKVDGDYTVVVHNADMIPVESVLDVSSDAIKIVVKNSTLTLGSPIDGLSHSPVIFSGENMIYIGDVDMFLTSPVITNIHGDGAIHFCSDNINPLYALHSYIADDNLFVKMVRETDYSKIFNNDIGIFLDRLRTESPGDKLLIKMDSATSVFELNKIMSLSARLHPEMLMDGVKILDAFESDFVSVPADDFNMNLSPILIVGDDFYTYGMRLGTGGGISENLFVAAGMYAAMTDYADDVNEYLAEIYGANFRAVYYLNDDYLLHGIMGASFARFDIGPVWDDGAVVYNPNGLHTYGATDLGRHINFDNSVSAIPFVGIEAGRVSVAGYAESYFDVRAGINLKYSFEMIGLRYDYGALVMTTTGGDIHAGIRLGLWSSADDAGADVGICSIRDADKTSYKLTVKGKFLF